MKHKWFDVSCWESDKAEVNHFWAELSPQKHHVPVGRSTYYPWRRRYIFLLWDVYTGSSEEIKWHVYQ